MRYLCFLLLACMLMTGCNHRYDYYDYDPAYVQTADGTVSVFMGGSWSEGGGVGKSTQRGSPYYLVVSYQTKDDPGGIATLEVSEFQAGSRVYDSVPRKVSLPTRMISGGSSDGARASLLVENIVVVHKAHKAIHVRGTVTYNGKTNPFSVTLRPKYWLEHHNDMWDALMSV